MADRKATNKYYPPGWDPSKGSINKYVGQHPLRDRARKLDQGILIVRFELPFNIWCDGCGKSIGKGVRFNAEKKKIGNYYSTAILSFRMKCHGCLEWIEVHTDPKNAEYVVVAGARRKKEDFEPEDNETIRLTSEEEKARMAEDPFYVLEKRGEDERRAKEDIPKLTMLQRLNDAHWADPYTNSQKLRKIFRVEKKAAEAVTTDCEALAKKNSLSIPVLPPSEEDSRAASSAAFSAYGAAAGAKRRRIEALGKGIFSDSDAPSPASSSPISLSQAAAGLALAAMRTKLRSDPFLKDAGVSGWGAGRNAAGVGAQSPTMPGVVRKGRPGPGRATCKRKVVEGWSWGEEGSVAHAEGGEASNLDSGGSECRGEKAKSNVRSLVCADYDDNDDE